MEWFRWYHDTASDAKFGVVARRSGQHKSLVVAVWASLLEYASKQDDRGTLSNIDIEEVAEALDLDMEPVQAIVKAFTDKNMIIESRIANWEKRQPVSDSTAAERAKKYRENQKSRKNNESVTLPSRDCHGKETDTETEEETEQEHTARVCDFSKFIEKAHKYLLESGNANLGSTNWVKGFLKNQFQALKVDRPDLKPEEIVYCWQLACDTASAKGAGSPEYYKKAFAGRIKDFKGIQTDYGKPGAKKKSETERFLEALEAGKSFRYKPNNTIYTADQLSFVAGEFPMVHIEPVDRVVGLVTIEIVRDPPPGSLS